MAIFDQPEGTRPGPTLMGRVLPGPIRNRVGYGFLKLKKKKTRSGSGFYQKKKKPRDLTQNPTQIKTRYPEITKIPYIYTCNLTLIPHFSSTTTKLNSLPASVRHFLSLISAQSHTSTLPHPHSQAPSCLPPSLSPTLPLPQLNHSDTPSARQRKQLFQNADPPSETAPSLSLAQ